MTCGPAKASAMLRELADVFTLAQALGEGHYAFYEIDERDDRASVYGASQALLRAVARLHGLSRSNPRESVHWAGVMVVPHVGRKEVVAR